MGRAPCCDNVGLRKGRWTAEEDDILKNYILTHGEGCWRSLPKNAGLLRCGKSCRLRWINYLRSDLKRGNMTAEEEETIVKLHSTMGNRWSVIASQLPGRTDNEIKNYWNSHLSRKILCFRTHTMINTASISNHPRIDPNRTTAATAKVIQPVQGRRGRGRTSRAAMKKNKGPYTTLHNKSSPLTSPKKNINVVITTTTLEKEPPDWNHVAHNDSLPADQSGGYQGLPAANQDHCSPEHEMFWFDDMMKDPHGDQWFSTSFNSFGDHQLMVDDDDQHDYDQLWMSLCGTTGGEEQEILSWLCQSDDDSFEEAQHSGKAELDSEKQEAMVAWLLS